MATLVAKYQYGENTCEYALWTAAHCLAGDIQQFDTPFGQIPASRNIAIPQEWLNNRREGPMDVAMIFFRSSCDIADDSQIYPLASDPVRAGQELQMNTQHGVVLGQVSSSEWPSGDRDAKVHRDQIVPGDSGGGIFNAAGEVVGAISASGDEWTSGFFSNPSGTQWARQYLRERYGESGPIIRKWPIPTGTQSQSLVLR